MMKIVTLCIVSVVWLQLPNEGDAVCCERHKVTVNGDTRRSCDDCSAGTPYCSRTGSCNIFACKCDGGCRTGMCSGSELSLQDRRKYPNVTWEQLRWRRIQTRSADAHDVIRATDGDGDGRMSLEEARRHLTNKKFPANDVKRSLMKLNSNSDI